jgi:hypothetical protein
MISSIVLENRYDLGWSEKDYSSFTPIADRSQIHQSSYVLYRYSQSPECTFSDSNIAPNPLLRFTSEMLRRGMLHEETALIRRRVLPKTSKLCPTPCAQAEPHLSKPGIGIK